MSENKNSPGQMQKDAQKVGLDAAKGLATGGIAGAAAGAVKGALKTKTGKRVGATVIAIVVVVMLAVGGVLFSLISIITANNSEETADVSTNNLSLTTMHTDVADDKQSEVDTIINASEGVPWEIMVAVWKHQSADNGGYGDYRINEDTVDKNKISKADAESLEPATLFVASELSRHLSAEASKGVPSLDDGLMESVNDDGEWVRSIGKEDTQAQAAKYAEDTFIAAINKLPLEGIKDSAGDIYRLAHGWRTGTKGAPQSDNVAPVCKPGDGAEGHVSIPEEYLEYVQEASKISGFSVDLIGAQIYAESSWNLRASSGVADGIAQFTEASWIDYGEGGDVWNPADAIPALGRYMKAIKERVSKYADGDEELIAKLSLFSYHNGINAISNAGGDYKKAMELGPKGAAYAEKIVKAAKGNYSTDCKTESDDGGGSTVPKGSIVETAGALAWDHYVSLARNIGVYAYGKAESRPEYVAAASKLSKNWATAYFTDCGVFVSTVMRTSGEDPNFPKRGTSVMMSYVQNSDKYEYFKPSNLGQLEPGDIMIRHGHIFIYTGKRNSSPTGLFQGASLGSRPPSGHPAYIVDSSGNQHYVARLKDKK